MSGAYCPHEVEGPSLAVCIIICVGIPLHAHGEPPDGWRPLRKMALQPMAINAAIQEDSETGLTRQFFRDIVELSFRRNNIRMMDSEWSPEFLVQFRALEVFRENDGTAIFSYALDIDVPHRISTSCLYKGNSCTVDRVFVGAEGPLIAAQWKVLAATMSITASTSGSKLSSSLRRLAIGTNNPEAVRQIIALGRDLDAVDTQILRAEGQMSQLLYRLYDLDEDDVRLLAAS